MSDPFRELVQVMARLRSEGGCPWDLEQTHQSLVKFLQEEAYEAIEAIEALEYPRMCEELGDLLLQIVFQARIAEERGRFTVDDVCRSIADKMIRRHPHVFGDESLPDAGAVSQRWEQIKLQEKGASRQSLLDGIPRALPALSAAERVQGRAAEVGFEWPDAASALGKVHEELRELEQATSEEREDELGDLLFALVSLARQWKLDPEAAVRRTTRKFIRRFQALESRLEGGLRDVEPDELVRTWREVSTNT